MERTRSRGKAEEASCGHCPAHGESVTVTMSHQRGPGYRTDVLDVPSYICYVTLRWQDDGRRRVRTVGTKLYLHRKKKSPPRMHRLNP
jgi:hypothetical protein